MSKAIEEDIRQLRQLMTDLDRRLRIIETLEANRLPDHLPKPGERPTLSLKRG